MQSNWQEEMNKVAEAWINNTPGAFYEILEETQKPLTLKQKLSLIPYYCGYWLVYPFLKLAHELWDGIEDAYSDTWEE